MVPLVPVITILRPDHAIALDLPSDWSATYMTDRDLLLATREPVRTRAELEWSQEDFSVAWLGPTATTSLAERALSLMQRRVARGEPDRPTLRVGALRVDGYDWVDGVVRTVSCFVERRGMVYELSWAQGCFVTPLPGAPDIVALAEQWFARVLWLDTASP